MPNGLGNLKKLMDGAFGPPQEGIKVLREFTSGETSRKLDKLLARIERISKDTSAIPQVIELLKLIQEMNETGALDKLITLLQAVPKGKTGQALVVELRKVVEELAPRLDKLSSLAKVLMEKE